MRAALPFRRKVLIVSLSLIRLHRAQHQPLIVHRLFYTSFPHPAPKPDILNRSADEQENRPRIRGQPQASTSTTPDDDAKYYFFTIDDQLLYLSFFQDWGPLNLAMVYKACILIHELLQVTLLCRAPPPRPADAYSPYRTETSLHIVLCSIPLMSHGEKPTRRFSWLSMWYVATTRTSRTKSDHGHVDDRPAATTLGGFPSHCRTRVHALQGCR